MQRERVSIFIDGSNLYHSLRKIKVKIKTLEKYQELINILLKDRTLINIFYYNASLDIKFNSKKYWRQQKFFEKLKKIPKLKLIICKLNEIVKKICPVLPEDHTGENINNK